MMKYILNYEKIESLVESNYKVRYHSKFAFNYSEYPTFRLIGILIIEVYYVKSLIDC